MYSHLEDYIYELYLKIGITEPKELDLQIVARKLSVEILDKKKTYMFEDEIFLEPGTDRERWMNFGHEICHYLRHCGNQLNMHQLFIDLQEYQADYFAYHFCVPTFMLEDLKVNCVADIMKHFNVDCEFALRRLEMYENKQIDYSPNYATYQIAENQNNRNY
ncbi:ImmA/IrrE family metallo-endopeptidase [Oceanobacillus oncorhynchi]|uniref:ImmA/IrrE family metallo-endopeptidase n=1 Tax=Oceanobacillus oncorhynchi TaxID=545501 RepID=UPI0021171D2E|nr:ImmA/IrrE family metallo-endopeptidase [Oceanobacillus oncorhynchi]UUI41138.1 ImmA/IrrE family metallo-endopeptidase [Oceanobacillus oncorhynchi]